MHHAVYKHHTYARVCIGVWMRVCTHAHAVFINKLSRSVSVFKNWRMFSIKGSASSSLTVSIRRLECAI